MPHDYARSFPHLPSTQFGRLGFALGALLAWLIGAAGAVKAQQPANLDLFRQENLVAWCIVPFDAKRRGPEERAEMLARLGFKKFAYDWRGEHIPTFDAEIAALKKQGVELTAWWFPAGLNNEARQILEALQRNGVKTQLWVTMGDPGGKDQAEKVANAVNQLAPLADAAAEQGCTVGLYNHGGWFGEPENQLAIIAALKRPNVGIVYNQHHGHEHLERFAELLEKMKPHLYALNLNGMLPRGDQQGQKILQLGQGELDLALLKVVAASGYRGPIGILGHTQDDAEARLADNLDGLKWLLPQLAGKPAGEKPQPRTPVPTATKTSAAPPAQTPGWLVAGRPEFRTPPLTVECRARVDQREGFNILVASDTKASANHWELFSFAGSGALTLYLPGYEPDHVRSSALIADGKWHEAAAQFEPGRVRLYLDGVEVANQVVKARGAAGVAGDLALGRLVEGGIGNVGDIEWVRLSSGAVDIRKPQAEPPAANENTLGLWKLPEKGGEAADSSKHKSPAKRVGETASSGKSAIVPSAAPAVAAFPPEYDAKTVSDLLAAAQKQGDAHRGLHVFRSAKFACLNCHKVGEHGGAVGPALADAGKRLKPEEIAEAVLWPKRTVKPEFSAWRIRMEDGRSLQGYKRSETPDAIQFFDPATQKTESLAKAEIEELREAGTLMPDGLANAMTAAQRRDVVRFLLELGRTEGLEKAVFPEESPATFAYDRAPLDRAAWQLWEAPVNRDRLYDFYRKEALHFRGVLHRPHLLPAYPGLDGGKLGHWGNQNEEYWKDGRWSQNDHGTLLSGVTHLPGGAVPKGVCLRLGEKGELSACFNPETLTYDAVWRGGFVKFSDIRHGFMDGLRPAGEMLPKPTGGKPEQPFVYRGFYRVGPRVVFAYRLGDVEMLDSPWVKDGQFERSVAPADKHPLRAAIAQAPAQWPQEIKTEGKLGPDRPYTVDTIMPPFENPWKALLFFGDHDFLPDGSAVLGTMTGDVWRVTGLDAKLDNVRWRRIASGLHQPQGLVVSDGKIYVLGRDQITRLTDLNNDGEVDFYECFSNKMLTSSGGHDFTCGLARDKAGRFYTASGKQGLIRISADGQMVDVLATGFRNPDGLGLCADGAVTVPCSEGDWTPSSMLCLVKPDQKAPPHFGYGGPKDSQPPALPFVYLPRGLDNSSGGQAIVNDQRFGPLAHQILHFSFGTGAQYLVLRDEVAGQPQGAVVPLPGEFRSGAHRGKVNPQDGQLYVSGMSGWGSYTPDDGCFHRVRYTGQAVQLPASFHLHENGVRIEWVAPVDRAAAGKLADHFAQVWNYRYGPGYGSPELAPSHPGVVGHEALEIAGVHILGEKSIFVELPDLQPVNQLHLLLQLGSGPPQELFITANKLDRPFTQFPGYQPSDKVIAAHPQATDLALLGKQIPNPWRKKGRMPPTANLEIAAGKNLTFSTRTLRCKAGESVQVTFHNPDVVPHNWVLLKPGTLATVGDLANKLIADPEAVLKQYVPANEAVLAYTDIVPPQQQFSIYFQAPQEKGRYPYLCTFPGHWMVMNGELVVE